MTSEKQVEIYNKKFLQDVSALGMRGVDPLDIRPPQILLIQASSAAEDFKTPSGQNPKVGQFFHTGRNEIMDTFECFFLLASKGEYTDRNKNPPEQREQYRTIGCMTDDFKPFMMNFRSSAMYALSPLFTAAASNGRPMFSIRAKIETKELQNSQGKKWRIPVVRVVENEKDQTILNTLYNLALGYDKNTTEVMSDSKEELPTPSEEKKDEAPPF